uniref:LITAF domain-containing protein n=1 Tax=Panagrolaimus sp. PS1159 TaxID=55785 RepID=A0AC35FGE0_9BILA
MGYDSLSDLPIYAPRPGYNPNTTPTTITSTSEINDPLPPILNSPSPITTITASINSSNNPSSPFHVPLPSPIKTKTVYITIPLPELDSKPQRMICPNCRNQIKTKVTYKSSESAWASCCLLACFGCCLCCLLPFCLDSFKDIEHKCPKCDAYIGKYHK